MSKLESICHALLRDVKHAAGVAVVDLQTGLCLAVAHNVPYFTQSYIDVVSASAADMFRGKTISNVEQVLTAHRGTKVERTLQEMQFSTPGTIHFMATVPGKPDALLVMITSRQVDTDAGWAAVRQALPIVAPFCPWNVEKESSGKS